MKRRRPRLTKNMRKKLQMLSGWAEAELYSHVRCVGNTPNNYGEYLVAPKNDPDFKMYYDMLDACDWIARLAVSGTGGEA